MTYLADKLKYRVDVQKAIQDPTTPGGYDHSYNTLITVWGGVKPVKRGQYLRGVQVGETATHDFIFRKVSFMSLNMAFTSGFSSGFKIFPSLNDLKTEYFLFVNKWNSIKGKRFRIKSVINNEEDDEFYKVFAEEIEERGTGYPA
jgi:hypothetical protein